MVLGYFPIHGDSGIIVFVLHHQTCEVDACAVLHFDGDVTKATILVTTRRGQVKGTSTDKNDAEETFLLCQAPERSFTQSSVESQTPYSCVVYIYIYVCHDL